MAVLDEAANVCKLPELPDWYSHFGSQGIVIVTMLQSLAQAAKVWSKDKLDMLVDSSNVYIYAGSSNNESYLSGLSRMIGQRDVRRRSRSHSNSGMGSTSTSESWSSEPILGIDDLKALPAERAVLATSGNRTVVTTKNSYWLGPLRRADRRLQEGLRDRTRSPAGSHTQLRTPHRRHPGKDLLMTTPRHRHLR